MTTDTGTAAPADQWVEANKATRAAATWVVGALAALAVAIYGATPIVKAFDLSWSDPEDVKQLQFAAWFGVFGLLAMIGLILMVGRTMVPFISSRRILESTRQIVARDPATWLPAEMESIADLEEAIARARSVKVEANARLRQYRASGNAAGIKRETLLIEKAKKRIDVYTAWITRIVRLDGFQQVRRSFLNGWIVLLAVVAAIGSLGFTLALPSGGGEDADDSAASDAAPVTPQLGYISPGPDTDAATALYAALGLDGCVNDDQVTVVVLETDGSRSTVETVPSDTCGVRRFTVISDVIALDLSMDSDPTVITYTPAPTPTPTPTER